MKSLIAQIYERTRIYVYETLCLQQMLVHKGGHIGHWGEECRDGTPIRLKCQRIQIALHVFYNLKEMGKGSGQV